MRIYVDELPECKNCVACSYYPYKGYFCKLDEGDNYCKSENNLKEICCCPLKSLSDYTKQVRKEVLADLKEKYKQKMANALSDDEEIGHINCDDVLEELLEEIGFDEVLELYISQVKWYA